MPVLALKLELGPTDVKEYIVRLFTGSELGPI